MAYRRLSEKSFERPGKKGQIDIAGAGTTDWLIIDRHPDGINTPITVGLSVGANNGYVQMTNDSEDTVMTASAASTDWALGSITGARLMEIPSPVTAIRAVTTGAGQLTVQR